MPDDAWASRWRLLEGVFEIQWTWLLFNIAVLSVLSAAATVLWAWRRSGRRPWQLSLRELMLMLGVLAVLLSVPAVARQRAAATRRFASALQETEWWSCFEDSGPAPWYLQPYFDLRMLRSDSLQFMTVEWRRGERLWENAPEIDRGLAQLADKFGPVYFVRTVTIDDSELSDYGVQHLCRLFPYCKNLDLFGGYAGARVTADGFRNMAESMSSIKNLGIGGVPLSTAELKAIGSMTALEELTIFEGCGPPPPDWTEHLAALGQLRELSVPEQWRLDGTCQAFARQRGIEVWDSMKSRPH